MTRYLLAWLAMLVLAIGNGAVRQLTFGKHMSELRAHQLSTATGSIVIGLFIWFVIRVWPPSSADEALEVGVIWLILTVVFESAMGRIVSRRPWRSLLADYNLMQGRVWVLFLAWLTVAPYFFYRLQ